jgi:hypothetical protein
MATQQELQFSEKKGSDSDVVHVVDPEAPDEITDDPHMHRALKGRQVSMIAIVSMDDQNVSGVFDDPVYRPAQLVLVCS